MIVRDNNITVFVEVYNEAHRLGDCLQCFTWANELVVFVKPSSDNTLEIARRFTSFVYEVPYCDGSENWPNNLKLHKTQNDWFFFITASSRIDVSLSSYISKLSLDRDTYFDFISLPYRISVLGIHKNYSPWYAPYKTCLFKGSKFIISDKLHKENISTSDVGMTIRDSETDGYFYHITHKSPLELLERHLRYAKIDAKQKVAEFGSIATRKSRNLLIRQILKIIFLKRTIFFKNGFLLSIAYLSYFLMLYLMVIHYSKYKK